MSFLCDFRTAVGGLHERQLRAAPFTADQLRRGLALPTRSLILCRMGLIYPITFVGHDEWMKSGYAFNLAVGDVITWEGEVLGSWCVVDYDPEVDDESGRYEFVVDGKVVVMFAETFAYLDYRTSRGIALSTLTRVIREWHEAQSA